MASIKNPIQSIQRPTSLHQTIQDSIRAYIIENKLEIGDLLPSENELSKQLGVSRNLVREAVRGLEALGVIEIRRGSGLYVGEFSFEMLMNNLQYGLFFAIRELTELYAIRLALETGMIENAIQVRTEEQVQKLKLSLDAMRQQAEKGEPFPEDDRRFHQILFENLGNQTLLHILDSFWLALSKANQHVDIQDNDPMWTYNLHVPIVEAFEKGDIETTRAALRDHHIGLEIRLKRVSGSEVNSSE